MNHTFAFFEQGINRVAMRHPGLPQDQVVLNRLLHFVVRTLDDRYDRFLATYGLNSTSFLALAMIYSSEGNRLNPSDLSDALISSRTNVTRLSNELTEAGWVDRRPSSEDRRRVELSMTGAGSALLETVFPDIWAHITRQWTGFTKAELKELERLLRKLLGGLSGSAET
jgi:MarR family transcriptional regulator, negative regulator of the multidrug operon emrRAB